MTNGVSRAEAGAATRGRTKDEADPGMGRISRFSRQMSYETPEPRLLATTYCESQRREPSYLSACR